MKMNLHDMSSTAEYIKSIFDMSQFDLVVLLFNFFIALVFLIVYYDIKIKDIFKEKKFMILLFLVYVVDFILECIFGNIIVIIPAVSFFAVHTIFLIKDKELLKTFENIGRSGSNDDFLNSSSIDAMNEIKFKMKKLGKTSNFNLIDILYIYDYISDYQRRKVIQTLIYEDPNGMVTYLQDHPAVSDEELKEAKAILNLITLQGRVLTKEEALLHIVDLQEKSANKSEKNKNEENT